MKHSLRSQMMRLAFVIALALVGVQVAIFIVVDLTDLTWPPTSWPWVVRSRVMNWINNPAELGHELREFSSLIVIGLLALPLVLFAVGRYSRRIFGPVEEIARKARDLAVGDQFGRLPESAAGDQDEITVMARACNRAFDRYQEVFQRMEKFTRDASHQLRTPLASIRASGEVALSRPRSVEEYRETITQILERSGHLLAAVEALLERARRDPITLRSRFTSLDAGRICEEAFTSYRELAEARHVHLETRVEPGPPLSGDHDLLLQALCNLVDNAVRLTPENGKVTIVFCVHEDRICLAVEDTGEGIPEEVLARLFRPLPRDGSIPNQDTGIGLMIAADIVELHGGRIDVQSQVGHGTTFRILLPPASQGFSLLKPRVGYP